MFSEGEILEELNERKIEKVNIIKIKILNKEVKEETPVTYLIVLSCDSEIQNLTKIKSLKCHTIKWEEFKSKKVFQCHKCQLTNHSAKNCELQYRCVKCLDNHLPGQCISKANPDFQPQCVNCGKTGHPASYRGCEFLKYATSQVKEVKYTRIVEQKQKINKIYNQVQPGVLYSNVSKGYNSRENLFPPLRQSNHNNNQASLEDLLNSHTQMIIDSLAGKIDKISTKVDENSSKIAKIATVLNIKWD